MRLDNDISYYRRREAEALARAARSIDGHIARIHREMAERYAAKVQQLSEKPATSQVE